MGSKTPDFETLQIRRTFATPREKVFRAWTELEALDHWMCRDVAKHEVKYLELDVRAGGRYQIEIKDAGGETYLGRGIYREVKRPEKLVFTWAWTKSSSTADESLQTKDSLITVELFTRGDSTEVVLTQELLQNQASKDSHKKGWEGCFDKLAEYLKK
jgi:uncharacterized protein YndB with AHSA1/START domain